MKKSIVIGVVLILMSFTDLAQANFIFDLSSPDACSTIPGQWSGTGNVSNWLVNCDYEGGGSGSKIDGAGNFTMDFAANKKSGSFLCPSQYTDHYVGNCSNGRITIVTNYGSLTGNISGNSGSAKGTITVSGIDAQLEINIRKIGS